MTNKLYNASYPNCIQGPRAANDSGPRMSSAIKWIVIHSAEASDEIGEDRTAEGVANYFANPRVKASTQLAVDSDSCVRMLPDLVIPWGATGGNTAGLHVEICGRAGWTKQTLDVRAHHWRAVCAAPPPLAARASPAPQPAP